MVGEELPTVYRLHARTASLDRKAIFRYLLDHRLIGVGWNMGDGPLDWETYKQRARDKDGKVSSSVRAMHGAPDGGLVWMRDPCGSVYWSVACSATGWPVRANRSTTSRTLDSAAVSAAALYVAACPWWTFAACASAPGSTLSVL